MSAVTIYALCMLCSRPVRYQRNIDRWVDLSGVQPRLCEYAPDNEDDDLRVHWPDRATVHWTGSAEDES